MKVLITGLILLLCLGACDNKLVSRKDKASFETSKVVSSFKSIGDMNDSYFVIKENNFFEFYKILYDSVKNSRYPGTYTNNGDTLLLRFYNKKGYTLLGHKAMVNKHKKEIVFFDNFPGVKKRLLVN